MPNMSALQALAQHLGVIPAYWDIWGGHHVAGESALRATLAAMGHDCATESECEATLDALRQASRREMLPPVWVRRDSAPLLLRLPDICTSGKWRLRFEDGSETAGEFQVGELPPREAAEGRTARELPLPPLPLGYHALEVAAAGLRAVCAVIVCPQCCHELPAGQRVWGLGLQLYGLRSRRNWGMGDYGDLATAGGYLAQKGGALLGINPLHGLFPERPPHASPYSPSSRCFLNPLYLDVTALEGYSEACLGVRDRNALDKLRPSALVDYEGVARLKWRVLRRVYQAFAKGHLKKGSTRAEVFAEFVEQGGEALARWAIFCCLQTHFHAERPEVNGWQDWPAAYRDPTSPEVAAFAAAHAEDIHFHQYLEWQGRLQLGKAGRALSLGLYGDLAVGVERGGADVWIDQRLYALDASVGAPPDDIGPQGQDWGLPPWLPERLRGEAYAPFIRMLRANMAFCGALRIDHIMGLFRLFWVPPGHKAEQGLYVRYPIDDLMGIVALESVRNRCVVVGEDLGTVPDEVRAAMARYGVLSYRVFYFEKDWSNGRFKHPHEYPAQALVAATTHDLPTLAGFWRGRDLDWRERLRLCPPGTCAGHRQRRAEERTRLLQALQECGLDPGTVGEGEVPPALTQAVYRLLARTPSAILMVQGEDLLAEEEQPNLPGTVDGHPNWRRRLSINLEDWGEFAQAHGLLAALAEERPPR